MFFSYIEKKMLLIFCLVNASVSKYVVCSKLNCYCRWIIHLNKLFHSSEDSHLQMPVLTAGNSTRVKPYTIFYLHGNRSMTSNYTNTKILQLHLVDALMYHFINFNFLPSLSHHFSSFSFSFSLSKNIMPQELGLRIVEFLFVPEDIID